MEGGGEGDIRRPAGGGVGRAVSEEGFPVDPAADFVTGARGGGGGRRRESWPVRKRRWLVNLGRGIGWTKFR